MFYAAGGGAGGGRGFNVAVIDPASGALLQPVRNFDTWGSASSGEAMDAMVVYLNGVPNGALLLLAVADDAGLSTRSSSNDRGIRAIEALGSLEIRNLGFRGAWCLVAIKGDGRALDERRTSGAEASVSVTLGLR